jgi:glycosyltransferase involved in cell wall biosynthesis
MKITIVAESYPSNGDPSFPFVQQLAYALSKEGHQLSVIAPQSVTKAIIRRLPIKPIYSEDISPENNCIQIYRPRYLTFSNTKNKLLLRLSDSLLKKAILKGIKLIGTIDVIYCYFWHIGLITTKISGNIPLFVQASECEITVKPYMITEESLNKVKGVVCGSGKNLNESIDAGLTDESKCKVIVNGYRPDQFYPIDRIEQRRSLGFPEDKFIIAFVGGFIERKGVRELSEAIDRFDDVYSIFIGRGDCVPSCRNILFQGSVDHEAIVNYLNCADIFVLPTKAEGCCNAIIEALACGLPVISSNKSFNNEILDDTCSIRIDETDVNQIAEAISTLKDNSNLRDSMSLNALYKSKQLRVDIRGQKVARFIEKQVNICDKENNYL